MVGKCFVRGNDLTFDPSDEWQTHTYEACSPFNVDHEGLCNMGISAGMTDTDVYMGAVGSYTWQGKNRKRKGEGKRETERDRE